MPATAEDVSSPVLDPTRVVHELLECPTCHGTDLEAVTPKYATNFRCVKCHRCWHFELGWVHRVDPHPCRGCRYRQMCLTDSADARFVEG